MKKLLTALCSLALAATMGFGVSALAESSAVMHASNAGIDIEPITLTATVSFANHFTVDPDAETLAGIWGGSNTTIENTSGAPIFYIYSDADYSSQLPLATYDLSSFALKAGVNTTEPDVLVVFGRTDLEWSNLGTLATLTDFWIGTGDSATGKDLVDIYTAEGTELTNVLASKYSLIADKSASDSLSIRTGTSWASAVDITLDVTVTIALTANGYQVA